jgi:hypothetical protein
MFVHGDGVWHMVRRTEDVTSGKLLHTYCGLAYSDEMNTSREDSIRQSQYFCTKCFVEMGNEEDRKAPSKS